MYWCYVIFSYSFIPLRPDMDMIPVYRQLGMLMGYCGDALFYDYVIVKPCCLPNIILYCVIFFNHV